MMPALFASVFAVPISRFSRHPGSGREVEDGELANKAPMRRILIALAFAGTVAGCSSSSDATTGVTVCDAVLVFAVAVDVRDARTGNAAAAGGVLYGKHQIGSAIVTDTGTTVMNGLTIYTGSFAGTYDLRLHVPGYSDWTHNGVVVPPANPGGACGTPVQVRLQATIQPTA